MGKKKSAKERLKEFLRYHVGEVVTAKQLQEAASISEWARRIRELRDEEGWAIQSHHDSDDLKPGEYRLESLPSDRIDIRFQRGISQRLRAEVFDRNGFTCQMCGLTPGDIDPATNRKVRLHVGHIVDKNLGGLDELDNLRTLCSTCNQGAKNVTREKPSEIWLLSQLRRAGNAEQRAAYEWLRKKFGQ
jgi:hypothetical protein